MYNMLLVKGLAAYRVTSSIIRIKTQHDLIARVHDLHLIE